MPTCRQCARTLPLHDFSDAQLAGRGKCLSCSNPRLFAKRQAAGLDHLPLEDLGRKKSARAVPEGSMRECTSCHQSLPLGRFSSRQLSGKGKCQGCAANSSVVNEARQGKTQTWHSDHGLMDAED